MLLAWPPLGMILLKYRVAQPLNGRLADDLQHGAVNSLGFPLHITEPAAMDRGIFGELPTAWLQQRLYSPAGPQWYDPVALAVYLSQFLGHSAGGDPAVVPEQSLFRSWIWCFLLFATIGVVTYIVYPMSPPWLASTLGFTDDVHRISETGW
jgi:hypothetical protein